MRVKIERLEGFTPAVYRPTILHDCGKVCFADATMYRSERAARDAAERSFVFVPAGRPQPQHGCSECK